MPFTPLTSNDDKEKQDETEIIDVAQEILSEVLGETAKKTEPLFLKNRTLTITCSNSEVAGELRENMEEIVMKINKKLGKQDVDRIRYLL